MKQSVGSDQAGTKRLGNLGENAAAEYLIHRSYRIIHRNFHISGIGEIDIVAEKSNGFWPFISKSLVFVEVKSISASNYFVPEMHIDERKKKKLKILAQAYQTYFGRNLDSNWRIDVIAVEFVKNEVVEIRCYENAVHN